MRILVVCAEGMTRSVAQIVLASAGHRVASVPTADEALAELARGGGVDLLVVDGALPAEATTDLCHASLASGAPWAVVLANDAEEAAAALAAGAIDRVAKPVERAGLLACLARIRSFVSAA